METQLKQFLLSFDDKDNCEFPPDFSYKKAMSDVKIIKPLVEKILDHELEIDECVQDASFFTELVIFEEKQNYYDVSISIRFSSFGKLVSIFSNNKDIYAVYPMERLICFLENYGYNFIEADLLEETYDGINKYLSHKDTWWIRYFDYL